jgi:pimeloyl-ACP methyl ester carboxylesterase
MHLRLPGSAFVSVKDAGHMLPLEAPAECAGLVTDWIMGIEGAKR